MMKKSLPFSMTGNSGQGLHRGPPRVNGFAGCYDQAVVSGKPGQVLKQSFNGPWKGIPLLP